jgi:hypothetical protein
MEPKRLHTRTINGEKIILTPNNGKKVCVKCLEEKDFSEFYKNLKGKCKECFHEAHFNEKIMCDICGVPYTNFTKILHYKSKHHTICMSLAMNNFRVGQIMNC